MKKIILIIIAAAMALSACSTCKNKTNKKISVEDAAKIGILLTKSECFGKCPAFTLHLTQGKIRLNAINNMAKKGQFDIQLKDEEIIDIYSDAIEGEVFQNDKEETYDKNITDLPYCKMTLNYIEKFKIINYRGFAPKSIKKIDEKLMNIIADTSRYIQVDNNN